jgi:hypothetical protein
MRRISIVAVLVLFVLAVVGQFVAPRIVAGQAETRLTKDGGTARVDISAFPWPRVLFGEGDSLKVRASGLSLPLIGPNGRMLGDLDGFDDVDVEVTNATAGPFRLSEVKLERRGGDRPYRATIAGTITARDLVTFSGSLGGGAVGGFLGGLAAGALPFGDQPVPLNLDAVIRSDGGQPRALTVTGSVGGVPAGPLVEALAQALAGRF